MARCRPGALGPPGGLRLLSGVAGSLADVEADVAVGAMSVAPVAHEPVASVVSVAVEPVGGDMGAARARIGVARAKLPRKIKVLAKRNGQG